MLESMCSGVFEGFLFGGYSFLCFKKTWGLCIKKINDILLDYINNNNYYLNLRGHYEI